MVKRSDFPKDFIFGSATSAHQVEGAWNTHGKSPSNWDVFTRTPGHIHDGKNARAAIDQYNRIEEDVDLIKQVGLDSYRFSIAWSRVLPKGRWRGRGNHINQEGIEYYSKLIGLLKDKGIEPCVTIFHWDIPQCLEDEYGGFLDPRIVSDFCEFAELCFQKFGKRVKHWITMNEPWAYAHEGYVTGHFPPARGGNMEQVNAISHHRCKPGVRTRCSKRRPGTEPYKVAHNLILSHAYAVDIYKKIYQEEQGGNIGIANVSQWFEPLHDTHQDRVAASRAIDFMLGWFVAPIVFGDYPHSMKERVGERLPKFSPEEKELVKGSYDFLGINYYSSVYATHSPQHHSHQHGHQHHSHQHGHHHHSHQHGHHHHSHQHGHHHSHQHGHQHGLHSYETDREVELTEYDPCSVPIGPKGGSTWLNIYPSGIYKLLLHIKKTYHNPLIYITENGVDEVNNTATSISNATNDATRIQYHIDHLLQIKKAIKEDDVCVAAYYIWSMFDNFEWNAGYSVRFGIIHINFGDGHLTRTPKKSYEWFKKFLNEKKSTASCSKVLEKKSTASCSKAKKK